MAEIQTQWGIVFKTDEFDSGMAHAKELSDSTTKAVSEGWTMAGSSAVDALKKLLSQSEETHGRSKDQIEKASQAVDLLNDAIGIKVPAALQKMAASSEIAGPLLEAAFTPLAAIALAQVIVDVINKVRDLIDAWRTLSDEEKTAIDAQVIQTRKAIDFGRQVVAIRREAELIGKSEVEQARLRARYAAEDLAENEGYLTGARRRYEAAQALLKESEKGETRRVESSYRNPRTGMRSFSVVPVISDEQVKAAQATIRELEGLYGAGLEDLERQTLISSERRGVAEKQAGQYRVATHRQETQAVTGFEKTLAADVQAIQEEAINKQMQDAALADQANLRAIQQQNEAVIRATNEKIRAITEEEIKGEIEVAKLKEQTDEQLVQQQFSRSEISKQQEISSLARLKQQELQVEIDYWKAIEQLHQGDALEVTRIEAQITKLRAQQELIRAKATTDSLTAQEQQYQKMANSIHKVFSGMQSVVSGFVHSVLSGSQTIGQAWLKMVEDMAMKFIDGLERQLMAFIEHKVVEIAVHAQTEATKEAVSKTTAEKNDLRTAYSAAKNAFKATAGIDVVGPILAPIAAAAAFAGVVSFGSAEGGQYYVPNNQLTMLHPQEMVLPAGIANQMRNVIGGGGSGGPGMTVVVNHSVSAVDAASFQGHIRRHSNMIANEVTRALKRKGVR